MCYSGGASKWTCMLFPLLGVRLADRANTARSGHRKPGAKAPHTKALRARSPRTRLKAKIHCTRQNLSNPLSSRIYAGSASVSFSEEQNPTITSIRGEEMNTVMSENTIFVTGI